MSPDGQRFIVVEYPETDPEPQQLRLVENFFALIEARLAAGR